MSKYTAYRMLLGIVLVLISSVSALAQADAAPEALCTTICYVDAVNGDDDANEGNAGDPFATIQQGIDTVSVGGTVEVAAGTYAESLVIDKAVTVQGTDAATTIIDGTGLSPAPAVRITSGGVTFDNFTVQNHADGITAGYPLNTTPGYWQNINITNNIVDNIAPGAPHGFGIYVGFEGEAFGDGRLSEHLDFTGLVISGNQVNSTTNACLVLQSMDATSPMQVTDNTFTGCGASGTWMDGARDITYTGNTIDSANFGMFFSAIDDGFFVANGATGPRDITITENTITNNNNQAVLMYAGWPNTININRNAIVGNGGGSNVENTLEVAFDATCNWWGAVDGPSGEGAGSGSTVSTNVAFLPWLQSDDLANPLCTGGQPGITVIPPAELETSETGTAIDFSVVLGSIPSDSVSVTFNGVDPTEGTVNTVNFTPATWDVPQVLTITGIDDGEDDGDITYTVTLAATSTDADYNTTYDSYGITNLDLPPGLPARLYPADGEILTGNTAADWPNFTFLPIDGVQWYQVWIGAADYSSTALFQWFEAAQICDTMSNTCTIPLDLWLSNDDYRWWMTYWGPNDQDFGTYWNETTFSVDFAAPSTFALTSPPDGTTVTSAPATIEWARDTNALWYQIWVGPNTYATSQFFGWVDATEICDATTCSIDVSDQTFADGGYEVWAEMWGPGGYVGWTAVNGGDAAATFTIDTSASPN